MPARSCLVPKYCFHRPSGRAYVRIHGRVVYCGKFGTAKSKMEYARLVAELAASGNCQSSATPTSDLTVVELCAAYLDYSVGYYKKNGLPTRSVEEIKAAIRILTTLYGQTPATDFGPLRLLAVQAALAQKNARSYVNKLVGYVKRIFKYGVSRQLLPPSVHTALTTVDGLKLGRTIAREPEPIMPVPDEIVDATIAFLPAVVADMVRLQRLTGCRPGEVCQLRPCDVDRSGEVWRYRPEHHKTEYKGRERTIFIGPKAQAILLPYLRRDAAAYCFSPADSVEKHKEKLRARRQTKVQPSQQIRCKKRPDKLPGDRYCRNSYCQAITRAVTNANKARAKEAAEMGVEPVLLPRWTANQLRHARATEVRHQFGLEAAQVSLGHSKADITQTYAERDARLGVEVAKKIG